MPDVKAIRNAILLMVKDRGPAKTICPSEVARKLWPDDWRTHMTKVREAAVALRDDGLVRITQGSKEVLDNKFVGPIRIQLKGN